MVSLVAVLGISSGVYSDEPVEAEGETAEADSATVQTEPTLVDREKELIETAGSLFQGGQREEALALLERETASETTPALEFVKGNLYYQTGELDKAVTSYEGSNKLDRDFLRAHSILGQLYHQRGEFEKARNKLSRAIKLGDRDGKTFALLGSAFLELGELESAEAYLREGLSRGASAEDWEDRLVESLSLQGKTPDGADRAPSSTIRLEDEVDRPPKAVTFVRPEYPASLLGTGKSGTVILGIFLDEKGDYITVYSVFSDDSEFEKAAMEAALQWRFEPAFVDDVPVKIAFELTLEFSPPESASQSNSDPNPASSVSGSPAP